MRNTDCFRLAKALLPKLPEFVTNKKDILFIAPIAHTVRGFLFESSAYTKEDFYFWWFFSPLVVPSKGIHLSYGRRLNVPGGDAGWRSDMEELPERLYAAMQPMALPLLRSIKTVQDTIDAICRRGGETTLGLKFTMQVTDINAQDDLACLYLLDGQFDEARDMLDKIIDHERGTDRRQWILDIVERMKSLRVKLLEDPQLAVNQVKAWQDYTFKALKLEKWR